MPNESAPGSFAIVKIAAGISVLATLACGGLTAEQRAAVAKVQVIGVEPAPDCQNLGVVSGSDGMGPGGVRAKSVLLGGNTVHVDVHGGTTAFFCPGPAQPRAAVPVVVP
jgi:hypothetical protein